MAPQFQANEFIRLNLRRAESFIREYFDDLFVHIIRSSFSEMAQRRWLFLLRMQTIIFVLWAPILDPKNLRPLSRWLNFVAWKIQKWIQHHTVSFSNIPFLVLASLRASRKKKDGRFILTRINSDGANIIFQPSCCWG